MGTSEDFKAAWRQIHDVFENIGPPTFTTPGS